MNLNRLAASLARRWRSLPPRTIRLRLTVIYGLLFLVCGAGLLAVTYALVSQQYTPDFFLKVRSQVSGSANGAGALTHAVPLPLGGAGGGASGGGASGAVLAGTSPGAAAAKALASGGSGLPQVLVRTAQAQAHAALGTLLIESGIALAITALIAAGLGWVVAGRALRPLRAITATAQDISASNLHRRLALDGPNDELRQLGRTFDALLERLEGAFTAQRQFAANVSHELRTPLTFERAVIEVALADPDATIEDLRAVCAQVLATGADQERLIEALLVLSRSQRGLERREPVNLSAIAAEALADVDTSGLAVEEDLQSAGTDGDERLVERLAANLVTNAVQHNRPGGRLEIATRTARGRAILSVANTGEVISPEDLLRLFEPFQRLEGARTSAGGGVGLGLSIVKAIAEAHGATITPAAPAGGGLSIEVSFPASRRVATVQPSHPAARAWT